LADVASTITAWETTYMCSCLRECIELLAVRFRQEPITVSARDASTGEAMRCLAAPRYLYRGESRCFDSTCSSIDRVRAGSDSDIAAEIEEIVEWVKAFTAHELELEEVGAHALLQHYGLPTELIDFTSDLGVAATFANDGLRDGEGCIGILDFSVAIQQFNTIFNLRDLQLAERAVRQAAFGVHPLWPKAGSVYERDLKRPEVCQALGLRWFRFRRNREDLLLFGREKLREVISERNDPIAGWLRHGINCYVIENGKLPNMIAEWFADRVPMVPLIASHPNIQADVASGRLKDLAGHSVEFVSPTTAGPFCEQDEHERSWRLWSGAFPEMLSVDEEFCFRRGIFRFPGT
jgi:FRG domain